MTNSTVPAIANMRYETLPVADLSEHPRNANVGDVGAIHGSLSRFGFLGTIIVQESTGQILAGNHRFRAAKQAGMAEVPVALVDLSDEDAIAFMIADNRTGQLATNDEAKLAALLQELAQGDGGLEGTGYDGDDLDELLSDLANGTMPEVDPVVLDPPPSAAAEALKKWKVKSGQLWRAGDQEIFCGDATDAASYRFSGDADIVWTDPPYGVNVGERDLQQAKVRGRRSDGLAIENDDLDAAGLTTMLDAMLDAVLPKLAKGGAIYVASPAGPLNVVFQQALIARDIMRHSLIWAKQQFVMGRADYHYQHEPIIYGWKPGAAHHWVGGRKQTSLLQHDRPHASAGHPTQKPVSLIAQCLANHYRDGALVLDPFCGSGSTLLAAHHLGMRGFGVEIDPKFVAVSLDRLQAVGLVPELA